MPKSNKGYIKFWTKEEKLRMIKRVKNMENSLRGIAREENIDSGQLCAWIKKYDKLGEAGLERKNNPQAPRIRKNMTENEKLQIENLRLRIELERLKKGYIVKGVGQNKKYYSIDKKNSK